MTTGQRADRAVRAMQDGIAKLATEQWAEIEREWAKAQGEKPKIKVTFSATMSGSFDAPSIAMDIGYGVKRKDRIVVQLDDPAQGKLPLEEEE